jgi:uncharacterized membrane protein YdjX (TVP38/TMEM64 family)
LGLVLALSLIILATSIWVTGALDSLSLSAIAEHHGRLTASAERFLPLALIAYVLAFALLTGACLPVALTLTLASGMVFGAWWGGFATAVASTMGAVLTYAAARSSLAGFARRRMGRHPKLEAFVERCRRRPFLLMLSARLMPLFPFAPVNIAAGLASIPFAPFVLATLLGAIPTSLAYSAIGSALGQSLGPEANTRSLATSPGLVWPLVGLAVISALAFALQSFRDHAASAPQGEHAVGSPARGHR